jgi:hypothetical protein
MAGDRLIHGIVENLGGEVMKGFVVGAADVHTRAPTDGLQSLEDLDILGGIVGDFRGELLEQVRHGGIIGSASSGGKPIRWCD